MSILLLRLDETIYQGHVEELWIHWQWLKLWECEYFIQDGSSCGKNGLPYLRCKMLRNRIQPVDFREFEPCFKPLWDYYWREESKNLLIVNYFIVLRCLIFSEHLNKSTDTTWKVSDRGEEPSAKLSNNLNHILTKRSLIGLIGYLIVRWARIIDSADLLFLFFLNYKGLEMRWLLL